MTDKEFMKCENKRIAMAVIGDEEQTLSDKIFWNKVDEANHTVVYTKDVKEFIKDLEKDTRLMLNFTRSQMRKRIKERAGEMLIK